MLIKVSPPLSLAKARSLLNPSICPVAPSWQVWGLLLHLLACLCAQTGQVTIPM